MAVVARDNVATPGEFTNVCKCHGSGVLKARAIPFEEGFPSSETPEACLRSQQQHINKKTDSWPSGLWLRISRGGVYQVPKVILVTVHVCNSPCGISKARISQREPESRAPSLAISSPQTDSFTHSSSKHLLHTCWSRD